MKFSILTLFPAMFDGPFSYSIINNAVSKKLISIEKINIRDFSEDSYKTVDDHPFGGGIGMIMKVNIIDKAINHAKCKKSKECREKIVLMDPKGTRFSQKTAERLSGFDHLVIVCGHYEGVDERVSHFVDEKISIGDFILTGGEIASMALVDSITRLIPGVLPKGATITESKPPFYLEYPQYTRPQSYKNFNVPKVLLSGNHKKIEEWRKNHGQLAVK